MFYSNHTLFVALYSNAVLFCAQRLCIFLVVRPCRALLTHLPSSASYPPLPSDRNHGERRHRGRSEDGRGRRRRDGESDRRRMKPPENDVEDTECAVCFCTYDNVFKTPKLLACGHTFCLECLARINVTSPELKTLSCPVCREVTELPRGRDLPRLGNNRDIISKLPSDMQRALSIRFKRSQGKLMLKNPPPNSPSRPNVQGITPTTVVDVGRPPNRMRGRLRRMFRSDQCYYAVVATIIAITVALMLLGILAFVIIPTVSLSNNIPTPRPPQSNNTSQHKPGTNLVLRVKRLVCTEEHVLVCDLSGVQNSVFEFGRCA
uniref:Ring finger protein 183 n=1 Tax=Neolamprologus brichardi TaxID=32507 RepID=A0A3Q4GU52_NEOBR